MRAHRSGNLHRQQTDAAGTVGDEQALAWLQAGQSEQCLPRRQGAERHRRLDEVQPGRHERHVNGPGDGVVGKNARADNAGHGVPRLQIAGALAQLFDGAGDLAAQADRQAHAHAQP